MTFDIKLVAIDFVNRRSDNDEIRLTGFGFFGRRLAVNQIVGQTGCRVFADERRIAADIAAARKKLGREPLFLVQFIVEMQPRRAFDAQLKFFLRVIKKPVNIGIGAQLIDFRTSRVSVKSESRRSAPEAAQNDHPHIRRVVADGSEHGRVKRMTALERSQIEMLPDSFEYFPVRNRLVPDALLIHRFKNAL